jgi:starch synthase
MPSNYEPCGLGQLIAYKYGTIPLVFKTGGLADTVSDESGFIFENYKRQNLVDAVKRSIMAYENKRQWAGLVKKAMGYDFSWDESARKYARLYEKALGTCLTERKRSS